MRAHFEDVVFHGNAGVNLVAEIAELHAAASLVEQAQHDRGPIFAGNRAHTDIERPVMPGMAQVPVEDPMRLPVRERRPAIPNR